MTENIKVLKQHFSEADEAIKARDLSSFATAIYQLFNNLTCHCFLNNQKKYVFQNQLEIIEEFEDDESDYDLNIAKGYLYLSNRNRKKAFHYLTIAISLDRTNDLSHALRASINSEINPNYLDDAKNAVLLNPNARNYFVLAFSFDYKKDKISLFDSIIYFDKAIELNNNFACAYNGKAIRYKELNNLPRAIEAYKECVRIEPDHWAYYHLSRCLSKTGQHREAIKYAKLGLDKHPNTNQYHFNLGYEYSKIDKFEEALVHFKTFLTTDPKCDITKKNIEICIKNILAKKLKEARCLFENDNYQQCAEKYKEYLNEKQDLLETDINKYFISLVKVHDAKIEIDKNNSHYKRLEDLRKSYSEKNNNGEEVTEEEENANKLMQYGLDYQIKFGNYQNEKICDIADKDPHYILWCIVNLEHFSVHNTTLLKQDFIEDPLFAKAIEINLLKELLINSSVVKKRTRARFDHYQDHYDSNYGYDSYNDYGDDSSSCPACQESPCMCSDPW